VGRNLALEILDVSAEGIRLRLSEPVQKGEGVSLAVPGPRGLIVDCTGSVVWWARAADGTYIAGISLDERLSDHALARLSRDGVVAGPDPSA
jgi:hypothetical protein